MQIGSGGWCFLSLGRHCSGLVEEMHGELMITPSVAQYQERLCK
jgi:hypothetical protein